MILNALQQKLNSLIGTSSGYVEGLPENVQKRIRALQNLQDKNLELELKFRQEVLDLEKKYLQLHQPLYDQRAKITSGEVEPSDEECIRKEEDVEDGEEEEEEKALFC